MASSSINIQGVKGGSQAHNEREKKLDYVKEELSYLNTSFKTCTVSEALAATEKLYVEKVKQKLPRYFLKMKKDFWHKNIAKEATYLLLDYAFNDLDMERVFFSININH